MSALPFAIISSQGPTLIVEHGWPYMSDPGGDALHSLLKFFTLEHACFTWSNKIVLTYLASLQSLAFTVTFSHAESIKPQSFVFKVRHSRQFSWQEKSA